MKQTILHKYHKISAEKNMAGIIGTRLLPTTVQYHPYQHHTMQEKEQTNQGPKSNTPQAQTNH